MCSSFFRPLKGCVNSMPGRYHTKTKGSTTGLLEFQFLPMAVVVRGLTSLSSHSLTEVSATPARQWHTAPQHGDLSDLQGPLM